MNDKTLLQTIKTLVETERSLGLSILKFICEIEKRKCYADLGFSSLFLYLTKELKYSEIDAYKRIESAKLLKEFPVIEAKIKSGEITPTNLSLVASSLKKLNIQDQNKKLAVIDSIQNKTKREVEESLFALTGNKSPKKETIKAVNDSEVQLNITISKKLLEKINKLKSLKNSTKILATAELLKTLVDEAIQKEDKKREPKSKQLSLEKVKKQTRYIPIKIKNEVWKRANGKCEWRDPVTQKKCESIFFLQYDHEQPYAFWGDNSTNNLSLKCSAHNLRNGIKIFGTKKMKR